MRNDGFRNLCSVVAVALGLATSAFAQETDPSTRPGLFVEPALTYETSSSSISYPAPLSNSSGDAKGFGIGARLGFHMYETFFLGVDGRYSMPRFSDSSTNYNSAAVGYSWGPVIGMQVPDIGVRLWASYIVDGELDPEKSGAYDAKFGRADGYRLGTGFRAATVSLNVEYQELRYRATTLEQAGPIKADLNFDNSNLNNRSWIASVSFPVEL